MFETNDLNIIAENINEVMSLKGIANIKELSKITGISYPTLAPILKGGPDFRISNLITLCQKLEIHPNTILKGLYDNTIQQKKPKSKKVRYIISLCSSSKMTYISIYDIKKETTISSIIDDILSCNTSPDEFIKKIKLAVASAGLELSSFNAHEYYVFCSVLNIENSSKLRKIKKISSEVFYGIYIESDARSSQYSNLGKNAGIAITINDGCSIRYRIEDDGETVQLNAGGFPLTDIAGNHFIGCEAIKHTINAYDRIEKESLLSNRILSLFNGDIHNLITCAYENPHKWYAEASSIVKELFHRKGKSYEIVKYSYYLLREKIRNIKKNSSKNLKILIAGDASHLYLYFLSKEKDLDYIDKPNSLSIVSIYGIDKLRNKISS
jgi:N-acetylglucosamine kinase-like BadF-type ATPase/DNA-binding Xre family transcriptional regulator